VARHEREAWGLPWTVRATVEGKQRVSAGADAARVGRAYLLR
jgi:hypothetical protein